MRDVLGEEEGKKKILKTVWNMSKSLVRMLRMRAHHRRSAREYANDSSYTTEVHL